MQAHQIHLWNGLINIMLKDSYIKIKVGHESYTPN